jgi:hypothetical protein
LAHKSTIGLKVLYFLHYLKRRRRYTQCDGKTQIQNSYTEHMSILIPCVQKALVPSTGINPHILTSNWKSDVNIILHLHMHSVQITNCNFTTSPFMSSTLGVVSQRHHAIITELHDSMQTCWLQSRHPYADFKSTQVITQPPD